MRTTQSSILSPSVRALVCVCTLILPQAVKENRLSLLKGPQAGPQRRAAATLAFDHIKGREMLSLDQPAAAATVPNLRTCRWFHISLLLLCFPSLSRSLRTGFYRDSPSCSSALVSHRLQSTLQSQWVFSNRLSRTSRTLCLSSTISVLELPSFSSTFTTSC